MGSFIVSSSPIPSNAPERADFQSCLSLTDFFHGIVPDGGTRPGACAWEEKTVRAGTFGPADDYAIGIGGFGPLVGSNGKTRT